MEHTQKHNLKQKNLGQYFTTNEELLQCVYRFMQNTEGKILEPSFGRGHIINYLQNNGVERHVVAVEIDDTLETICEDMSNINVHHMDFLAFEPNELYNSIVGNPPYFKLKKNPNTKSILKSTNIYVAFIEKAYNLLDENGELIFIIPSDFFKLTSGSKLKEMMLENGAFTHIYHPHRENMFKKAAQDVIVFRYQKGITGASGKIVCYNDVDKELVFSQGNIYFKELDDQDDAVRLNDIFEVKVGMVSGAEKVFANSEFGNIHMLTSSGTKQQILIEELPIENEPLHEYLMHHKKQLINRKIKKFNDNNWFQWGCLRNKRFMEEHTGDICIYAKVLTRQKDVFKAGKVDYYDGSLLCMYPKQQLDDNQVEKLIEYLNSEKYLQHFLYSGRYKVGQKTLADSYIPKSLLGK